MDFEERFCITSSTRQYFYDSGGFEEGAEVEVGVEEGAREIASVVTPLTAPGKTPLSSP